MLPNDVPRQEHPAVKPDRVASRLVALEIGCADEDQRAAMTDRVDVAIVGGGHKALVAAAYLARAGRTVTVLEQLDQLGGAAVSAPIFHGIDARMSRYAYLVSLLPEMIVSELALPITLASRRVASFTPVASDGQHRGLLIGRSPGSRGTDAHIADAFRAFTGSGRDYDAWTSFYARVGRAMQTIAPTLTEPLMTRTAMRQLVNDDRTWTDVFEIPIGATIERAFSDDTVRGIVATDAVIGTFASTNESLDANRCFFYHVVGNGTGEWKVPVGGMGTVTTALAAAAVTAGATLRTGATVERIESDGHDAMVRWRNGHTTQQLAARHVLFGAAPRALGRLLGTSIDEDVEGSQLKINLLLRRLPRLRCDVDPRDAFAGTLHVDEGYAQLELAFRQAAAGVLPTTIPFEAYCHTLTDPSILGESEQRAGLHALTVFALHTPARLFATDNDATRDEAVRRVLAALDAHFDEPLTECLARDIDGNPCIEAHSPIDLEHELGLPGGNIFHRPLSWPFTDDADRAGTWGVETDVANVFVCGAGAMRGGGVSGIPGRNAAMAVLQPRS
jgi:phytoene dehydrogenase-like protein